ncbi:MAG: formimidoylglutamate deiminase [Polyangiaceae bacterium]
MRHDSQRGLVWLPALSTAHSHAFQRLMRGRAQRPGPDDADDFWSWRAEMYGLAETLDPKSLRAASLLAFRELHRRGVRTVGEFHYLHHDLTGVPYSERTLLSQVVVEAALEAGLRICLLRVVYHRAGPKRPPEGAQRRFSDERLEDALDDVEDLIGRYRGHARVRIGIAPHSVRAVPPDWLPEIHAFAAERDLPVHMHVAEQPAEIRACLGETGKRPVELLADRGVLDARFVAVHATHLQRHEARLLGEARAQVCLCPTTERDLGDGLPDVTALLEERVALSVGVDSHVATAPLEDMRLVELGERLRTGRRVVLRPANGESPAARLYGIGSHAGARAVGFEDAGAEIAIRRDHPDLYGVDDEHLLDAVVFSAQSDVIEAEL